jgi:gamma-glutamyl:cysteine ligase YbdK (ATP-grasp superfamily)
MEKTRLNNGTLRLFGGYGFELEYMIVDRETLAVMPIADRVLVDEAGRPVDEIDSGDLVWSNELVMHVVELKTNGPAREFSGLSDTFGTEIGRMNRLLADKGAMLLPTGMHPLMDPKRETVLWNHEGSEIYRAYDRIFDCRGHGWANLQSIHINLPFGDDDEFGRLHAAVRAVLPIIPALAASTPFVEGRATGVADNRIEVYRANQRLIPEIAGRIIPERVFARSDYEREILEPMYRAIAPYDAEGILRDEWLNSRGAIARFSRNTIEIRLIDIQESPLMDVSVSAAVISLIRALVEERCSAAEEQKKLSTEALSAILVGVAREGGRHLVEDAGYLAVFGVREKRIPAAGLWRFIVERVIASFPGISEALPQLDIILRHGPLSDRILASTGPVPDRETVLQTYRRLALCLDDNGAFIP